MIWLTVARRRNRYGYDFPTAAPYNVPIHTITPTADGSGHTIHPDVVDFGPTGWNGFRYWMASTSFYDADQRLENPHIHCSRDGFNWVVPDGLTNPIDPWPGAGTDNYNNYNSDTDLGYDPDTDELICVWRECSGTGHEHFWQSVSADGSTWSTPIQIADHTQGFSDSPSLVRVSASEWRLYLAAGNGTIEFNRYVPATARSGPFPSANAVTITYAGTGTSAYHGDVIRHTDGRYFCLFQQGGVEYPGVSTDGVTFTTRAAILGAQAYGGSTLYMYRSSMQIDPTDPTMVSVWYTTHGVPGRWVFYTRVPLTAWTG